MIADTVLKEQLAKTFGCVRFVYNFLADSNGRHIETPKPLAAHKKKWPGNRESWPVKSRAVKTEKSREKQRKRTARVHEKIKT